MTQGIYNIISPTEIYIGASTDIEQRFRSHQQDLQQSIHSNQNLQSQHPYLTYVVQEIVPYRENLAEREQAHLDYAIRVFGKPNVMNRKLRIEPHSSWQRRWGKRSNPWETWKANMDSPCFLTCFNLVSTT